MQLNRQNYRSYFAYFFTKRKWCALAKIVLTLFSCPPDGVDLWLRTTGSWVLQLRGISENRFYYFIYVIFTIRFPRKPYSRQNEDETGNFLFTNSFFLKKMAQFLVMNNISSSIFAVVIVWETLPLTAYLTF